MFKRCCNWKWFRSFSRLSIFGIVLLSSIAIFFKTTSSRKNSDVHTQSSTIVNPIRRHATKQTIPRKLVTKRPEILRETQGIPKIIHQIWTTDVIPEAFHENIRGLVAHNNPSNWTYFFWTHAHGERLISDEFPRLLPRYTKAASLLKADILRLVVLFRYGGVYFDLDTVSVKPLDPYVETHNCSLVTDPQEHFLQYSRRTRPPLMITNSAMLCKPMNWFLAFLIEQLVNQSPQCRGAIVCTGPMFVGRHFMDFQGTNISSHLPIVDDFRYFEDMVDEIRYKDLNETCVVPFPTLKHEWSREICREWIKRGRDKRNISEKAYTYHTWFHTYYHSQKLKLGKPKRIHELVPTVTVYQGYS